MAKKLEIVVHIMDICAPWLDRQVPRAGRPEITGPRSDFTRFHSGFTRPRSDITSPCSEIGGVLTTEARRH